MRLRIFFVLVLVFVLPLLAVNAYADSFTDLAGDKFAVLAYSTVTNVPTSTITGNVGVYPGTAITGFGGFVANSNQSSTDGQVAAGYTIDSGTAQPQAAMASAGLAYNALQAKASSGLNLSGQNLGGMTLNPGVYSFNAGANLTGVLTLNFGGGSNEAIVIDIVSTLVTASGPGAATVVLKGWNNTDSVYWAVGSNATIGTYTAFEGNIISNGAGTDAFQKGATDTCGSDIALGNATSGEVSLDNNTISIGCNGSASGTVGGTGPGRVPEPGTLALLSSGLLAMVFLTFRKSFISSLSC